MGTISTMALLQNIIDTEVNAKRYAESNALIKEPFEVCPPNRVAAMHRTVALQESLRAEGALRDHTARNLSYYGPSELGRPLWLTATFRREIQCGSQQPTAHEKR